MDFFLSETRDREAARRFLKKALSNPDNLPPHVFARDGLRSYPAAIRELQNEGSRRRMSVNCETVEKTRAAARFQRCLAASFCGVRGIPG